MSRQPHPTESQLTQLGALLAAAGDSVAANGTAIIQRTHTWEPGPRAANLDPDTRGLRYEQDADGTVWPVPSDSTGEAAVAPPDAAAHLHAEYLALLKTAGDACARLLEFNRIAIPTRPPSTGEPDAWCRNHLAIGVCEPRHRGDLCRWCDDFRREHANQLPPASLLGARHRGQRITERMVKLAMRDMRKKAG